MIIQTGFNSIGLCPSTMAMCASTTIRLILLKIILPVPQCLEDLTKPEYKGLLVVENPATSSTGLAFLLATVAHFGDSLP